MVLPVVSAGRVSEGFTINAERAEKETGSAEADLPTTNPDTGKCENEAGIMIAL
jgi:hypothetical protein